MIIFVLFSTVVFSAATVDNNLFLNRESTNNYSTAIRGPFGTPDPVQLGLHSDVPGGESGIGKAMATCDEGRQVFFATSKGHVLWAYRTPVNGSYSRFQVVETIERPKAFMSEILEEWPIKNASEHDLLEVQLWQEGFGHSLAVSANCLTLVVGCRFCQQCALQRNRNYDQDSVPFFVYSLGDNSYELSLTFTYPPNAPNAGRLLGGGHQSVAVSGNGLLVVLAQGPTFFRREWDKAAWSPVNLATPVVTDQSVWDSFAANRRAVVSVSGDGSAVLVSIRGQNTASPLIWVWRWDPHTENYCIQGDSDLIGGGSSSSVQQFRLLAAHNQFPMSHDLSHDGTLAVMSGGGVAAVVQLWPPSKFLRTQPILLPFHPDEHSSDNNVYVDYEYGQFARISPLGTTAFVGSPLLASDGGVGGILVFSAGTPSSKNNGSWPFASSKLAPWQLLPVPPNSSWAGTMFAVVSSRPSSFNDTGLISDQTEILGVYLPRNPLGNAAMYTDGHGVFYEYPAVQLAGPRTGQQPAVMFSCHEEKNMPQEKPTTTVATTTAVQKTTISTTTASDQSVDDGDDDGNQQQPQLGWQIAVGGVGGFCFLFMFLLVVYMWTRRSRRRSMASGHVRRYHRARTSSSAATVGATARRWTARGSPTVYAESNARPRKGTRLQYVSAASSRSGSASHLSRSSSRQLTHYDNLSNVVGSTRSVSDSGASIASSDHTYFRPPPPPTSQSSSPPISIAQPQQQHQHQGSGQYGSLKLKWICQYCKNVNLATAIYCPNCESDRT